MNTKIIEIENLQIALKESNPGAKNTIFFVHGNSGSTHSWDDQLTDALFSNYNLIGLDLPGHGDSSAAINAYENYSIPGMGKIIAGTIKKLNLDNPYILVGFSLGTNVVAEMIPYLKPSGVVLVSSSVIGGDYTLNEAFLDGLDTTVFFSDEATPESVLRAMQKAFFHKHKNIGNILMNDYKTTKQGFRPTMIKTFQDGVISDEIELLKKAGIPILVVFGQDEKMANPNYLDNLPFETWKNKVFKLPDAGHYVQMDQPEKFNELLFEYIQDRFEN